MTDNASKAFKKATKRAYVPPWYSVAATGALVVVGAMIIVSFLFPGKDPGTLPQGSGGPVGPSTSAPASTEPSNPTETSSPTENAPSTEPSGETVTVSKVGGGTVEVPTGAYALAKKAGEATFTGDFSGVTFAEGASAPDVNGNPAATVTSVVLNDVSNGGFYTFIVTANADGLGTERTVTIFIGPGTDGGWAFYPS